MISWPHILVLLVVVLLVFGTKKLKNLGGDLGESIKGFKKAMSEEGEKPQIKPQKSSKDADFSGADQSKSADDKKA